MVVESVRIHMLTSQHVVILREAERNRYLPIWVGPNEADAIARRLQGVVPERPLTHDLFATALDELGVSLKQVIISELADETYRARLIMELGDRTVDVDARSSDAIALALRAGVVIYATDALIATRPDAIRGFLKGWFETIAFMRKNKAETVAIAKDAIGKDADIVGRTYDEVMPMFSDDGRFKASALKVLAKSFVELNTLPAEPDMSKLYTEAFLPAK